MRIAFPLLVFIFLYSNGLTQDQDQKNSLVLINDVTFSTETENKYFRNLYENETHAFELLMSINNDDVKPTDVLNQKKKLRREIEVLKSFSVHKKKSKYIKSIYSHIHENFLTKYELKNYFNEIFSSGNYNCVSACALYSLVLDDMGIPYTVKETPTHVYLIVNIEGEQVLIETTDPVGGFNKFSTGFKSNFVKLLMDSKLISDKENNENSIDYLFNKYYFTEKNVNLKQLIGLQYYNHGLYLLEDNNYRKALPEFQKSYLLYPSDKIKEVVLFTLGNLLAQEEHENLEGVRIISALSRYENTNISDADLENEFLRLTNEMLVNAGNTTLYDSAFNYLQKNINRENLLDELKYIYNYERGRVLYTKGNYAEALSFLDNSYSLKPNNADIEALYLSSLAQSLSRKNDSDEIINTLSYAMEKHKELQKNNNFGGMYLNVHLMEMARNFSVNAFNDGVVYQKKFEDVIDQNPNYKYEKSLVAKAYSQLAIYYFKRGQYNNAKSAINLGLKYAPGNYELLNRKRAINN